MILNIHLCSIVLLSIPIPSNLILSCHILHLGAPHPVRGSATSTKLTHNYLTIKSTELHFTQSILQMAIPISKLDRFKVETEFGDGFVVHTTYEWEFSSRQLKGSTTWREVKEIGAGAFGSVWLEKEEPGGKLRAVKRLQRSTIARTGFSQELLALITLTDVSVPVMSAYRAKVSSTNTSSSSFLAGTKTGMRYFWQWSTLSTGI